MQTVSGTEKMLKTYPVKPDIVLSKYKTVIFIHGCYWHGHYYKAGKLPETNKEFWENKLIQILKEIKKIRPNF